MELLNLTVTKAGDRWFVMNGRNVYAAYPCEEMARQAVTQCMANEADEIDGLKEPPVAPRGPKAWWRNLLIH